MSTQLEKKIFRELFHSSSLPALQIYQLLQSANCISPCQLLADRWAKRCCVTLTSGPALQKAGDGFAKVTLETIRPKWKACHKIGWMPSTLAATFAENHLKPQSLISESTKSTESNVICKHSSKTEYKKLITRLKHHLLMEPRAELWSIPKSCPSFTGWTADFSNWGCRYWAYSQPKPDTPFLPCSEKLAGFQAIAEEPDVYHSKRMTVSLKQKINQLGQQGITQENPDFHISSYPKDLSSLLLHCSYQSISGRQFKQVIRIQKQLQQEQLVPETGSCNSCPLLPAET